MKSPQRILDANANRVREALRVLEEAARFVVDDADLAHTLKQMRHDFVQAFPDSVCLIAHRDTENDVGTSLTTDAERSRRDVGQVVAAAGSRLSEALRVIEEYSKLAELGPGFAGLAKTAERLRYQSYTAVQRLVMSLGSGRGRQWRLCLLLTRSLCIHRPWEQVLEEAVAHGVDCVQVREKEMDDGPLLEHICSVQRIVNQRAAVIINDRPDLALIAGADGVHLGQTDLAPLDARRLAGSRLILGVSTSNLDQAKAAKAHGADYCGVGPMFPTTTKHKPVLAGVDYLRGYLDWGGLPHLAIGGITPGNLQPLIDAGVRGVAVSSAICAAEDPGEAAKALSDAILCSAAQPS